MIEKDQDRHSLVSMAKQMISYVNEEKKHRNFYTWQVLFEEELSHHQLSNLINGILKLMKETFSELEVEFVRKNLKNKKKKYKCIALLYYQPSCLSHVASFCIFTPFKSVGCYLDYMVSTRESLNKIDLCNEDKDSLSGRGVGLLLLRLVQAYIVRSNVSDSSAIYVDVMNLTQSSTFYSQLGFERIQQRDFPKEIRGHQQMLNQPLLTSMRITEGLPKLWNC